MYIGSVNLSEIFANSKMSDILLEDEHLFKDFRAQSNYSHYPYELEKKLSHAIITGNLDQIEKIMNGYKTFTPSILCQDNAIRSLKNNLICSCAIITRLAIQAGLDELYAFFLSDLYINKIESFNDEQSLLNLNVIMMLDFMHQIKNNVAYNNNHYSTLIKNVIQYINKNVYKNYTLTDVSTYVNVNSSYLSRIFKKEVGITFTQFIHNAKVKEAQHLLLFSNLSLVEISTKLGYATQSHFNKVFKQINGMTPKQFKQNHTQVK